MSDREVDTGHVTELVLRSTHVGDSGTYVCTATNTHGALTADFHLLVQGRMNIVVIFTKLFDVEHLNQVNLIPRWSLALDIL